MSDSGTQGHHIWKKARFIAVVPGSETQDFNPVRRLGQYRGIRRTAAEKIMKYAGDRPRGVP